MRKFGTNSASLENMVFSDESDPGLLIAFEGMDGSGKTTQRKLLRAWLEDNGEEVVVSKWNSSPLFKDLIKAKSRPLHFYRHYARCGPRYRPELDN